VAYTLHLMIPMAHMALRACITASYSDNPKKYQMYLIVKNLLRKFVGGVLASVMIIFGLG